MHPLKLTMVENLIIKKWYQALVSEKISDFSVNTAAVNNLLINKNILDKLKPLIIEILRINSDLMNSLAKDGKNSKIWSKAFSDFRKNLDTLPSVTISKEKADSISEFVRKITKEVTPILAPINSRSTVLSNQAIEIKPTDTPINPEIQKKKAFETLKKIFYSDPKIILKDHKYISTAAKELLNPKYLDSNYKTLSVEARNEVNENYFRMLKAEYLKKIFCLDPETILKPHKYISTAATELLDPKYLGPNYETLSLEERNEVNKKYFRILKVEYLKKIFYSDPKTILKHRVRNTDEDLVEFKLKNHRGEEITSYPEYIFTMATALVKIAINKLKDTYEFEHTLDPKHLDPNYETLSVKERNKIDKKHLKILKKERGFLVDNSSVIQEHKAIAMIYYNRFIEAIPELDQPEYTPLIYFTAVIEALKLNSPSECEITLSAIEHCLLIAIKGKNYTIKNRSLLEVHLCKDYLSKMETNFLEVVDGKCEITNEDIGYFKLYQSNRDITKIQNEIFGVEEFPVDKILPTEASVAALSKSIRAFVLAKNLKPKACEVCYETKVGNRSYVIAKTIDGIVIQDRKSWELQRKNGLYIPNKGDVVFDEQDLGVLKAGQQILDSFGLPFKDLVEDPLILDNTILFSLNVDNKDFVLATATSGIRIQEAKDWKAQKQSGIYLSGEGTLQFEGKYFVLQALEVFTSLENFRKTHLDKIIKALKKQKAPFSTTFFKNGKEFVIGKIDEGVVIQNSKDWNAGKKSGLFIPYNYPKEPIFIDKTFLQINLSEIDIYLRHAAKENSNFLDDHSIKMEEKSLKMIGNGETYEDLDFYQSNRSIEDTQRKKNEIKNFSIDKTSPPAVAALSENIRSLVLAKNLKMGVCFEIKIDDRNFIIAKTIDGVIIQDRLSWETQSKNGLYIPNKGEIIFDEDLEILKAGQKILDALGLPFKDFMEDPAILNNAILFSLKVGGKNFVLGKKTNRIMIQQAKDWGTCKRSGIHFLEGKTIKFEANHFMLQALEIFSSLERLRKKDLAKIIEILERQKPGFSVMFYKNGKEFVVGKTEEGIVIQNSEDWKARKTSGLFISKDYPKEPISIDEMFEIDNILLASASLIRLRLR